MRRRVLALSISLALSPLTASVYAITPVAVEQIEAYSDYPTDTDYCPVAFGSGQTLTDTAQPFQNITFDALTNTSGSRYSGHAASVGSLMYGIGSVAYPFVANTANPDVYCQAYDTFLNGTVYTQSGTGLGPLPGHFQSGVKVVNNSWVTTYAVTATDTDALRRIDYMINNDNVTFVAGAVTSTGDGNFYDLVWSSFNALAVSGQQTFSPAGGPGKQHADLFVPGEASYSAATVSGYATALYGTAQNAGQTDAMQNVVNRSLLMTAADKMSSSQNTANNLSVQYGAGRADYYNSASILDSGETPLILSSGSNISAGTVTGSPSTSQDGWSYGTVGADAQKVVLFSTSVPLSGVTASLNWNVTSNVSGGNINTAASGLHFPNLTLQVVPVTSLGGGEYQWSGNQSTTGLYSRLAGDNVQFLYASTGLAAGTYAFVIGGDSSLSANVGFSYILDGSPASQWASSTGSSWGTASSWTNGIPNGPGAQANFFASPGLTSPGTITLDGIRTVGQLTFNSDNSYNISSGTGGTLELNDSGDVTGNYNALINVSSGSQNIAAPLYYVYLLNINVASAGALNLSGTITGYGSLNKTGSGTVSFSNPNTGILVRTVPGQLNINAGTVALAATSTANRQLLVATNGFSIAGTTGNWLGRLDLNNNDLDETGTSLADVINQLQQGYNNGNWNGPGGIVSTSAATNSGHLTTLGVIQNNQSGSALFAVWNLFDGIIPGAGDILVKYTYYGDTNLDGKVDGTDYSRIDNGYLSHLSTWYDGDFNYDGVINGSDYTLIDNSFNSQGAAIQSEIATTTAQIAAVPEPAFAGAIGLVSAAMLLSRRRFGGGNLIERSGARASAG